MSQTIVAVSSLPGATTITDAPFAQPLYQWLPDEGVPVVGVVHILHGLAEYGLRYYRFAKVLNNNGWIVYANDHPGHGPTAQNNGQLGLAPANWLNNLLPQIAELHLFLKQIHPGKPLVLFGHSMGSFIAHRYVQLFSSNIDGLILSSTTGMPDPLLPIGIGLTWLQKTLLGSNYKSQLLDKLSFQAFNKQFKPNRTTHDWLSRNPNEVDLYVADPLCGFLSSSSSMFGLFNTLQVIFKEKEIAAIRKNLPVYGFAGTADPVGQQGKGFLQWANSWKKAGIENLTYKLYDGGRHEMLNEINHTEVEADLVKWLGEMVNGEW